MADVSSFANASGGDILFGVKEKRDNQGQPTGLPGDVEGIPGVNPDKEISRLEGMIRAGIQPKIPGIRIRQITGFENGPVIILRIPKSWASPHMVTFKNHSRFFSRTSNGKCQLDVEEIRSAFLFSESIRERIRHFRDDRVAKILANECPIELPSNSKVVLLIMPIASFGQASPVDFGELDSLMGNMSPLGNHLSYEKIFNADGILNFNKTYAYLQLFRSGIIESVSLTLLEEGDKSIRGTDFEKELICSLKEYLNLVKGIGLSPPIILIVGLLGVKGFTMGTRETTPFPPFSHPIDRDNLLLPEVLVDNFEKDIAIILRPIFDVVWQACGWKRSMNYDDNGKWMVTS